MRSNGAELADIAEYIAAMCDELAALSKPLQDAKLAHLLSIAADLARAHDIAVEDQKPAPIDAIAEAEPSLSLWDQILPARHTSHARASINAKRFSRGLR